MLGARFGRRARAREGERGWLLPMAGALVLGAGAMLVIAHGVRPVERAPGIASETPSVNAPARSPIHASDDRATSPGLLTRAPDPERRSLGDAVPHAAARDAGEHARQVPPPRSRGNATSRPPRAERTAPTPPRNGDTRDTTPVRETPRPGGNTGHPAFVAPPVAPTTPPQPPAPASDRSPVIPLLPRVVLAPDRAVVELPVVAAQAQLTRSPEPSSILREPLVTVRPSSGAIAVGVAGIDLAVRLGPTAHRAATP